MSVKLETLRLKCLVILLALKFRIFRMLQKLFSVNLKLRFTFKERQNPVVNQLSIPYTMPYPLHCLDTPVSESSFLLELSAFSPGHCLPL